MFNDRLDLEDAHTIPSSWYINPAYLASERGHVFGDSWQMVARKDQLAKPGEYVAADIAGNPIVVVNDNDTLRAFHNVCQHRGTRLVKDCGEITKFRCPYHGWTYDLEGKLRGTPEFDVRNFRKEDNGLRPVLLDTFGPFVFINLGCNPISLGNFLSPCGELAMCLASGSEPLRFYERREYTLKCNWKVFVDNYLDGGYHVHAVSVLECAG